MKITDYLAIWGAVIATMVAAWNIYKDFLRRHRVKVTAGFQVMFIGDGTPREDVFAVTVTNLSDRTAKVKHICGFVARKYKPRWLDRPTRRVVKRSTKAFLFSFRPNTRVFAIRAFSLRNLPIPELRVGRRASPERACRGGCLPCSDIRLILVDTGNAQCGIKIPLDARPASIVDSMTFSA